MRCPIVVRLRPVLEKRGCERCVIAGMHGWLGICWILKKYRKRLSVRLSCRWDVLVYVCSAVVGEVLRADVMMRRHWFSRVLRIFR